MKKNLLLSILLLLTFLLHAQMGLRHYRMEEGPLNTKMLTLFKKSNGYIYLGTSNGLFKFDGTKFIQVPFKYPVTNSSITAVFEDTLHHLWVGMESGDMGQVLNGVITLYAPQEGTPKKKINAFIQDKQNNIWYATNGEGIYYIQGGHIYNINTNDGLSDNYVYSLALAGNGDILAGTDQGINICSLKGKRKIITNISSKDGLPDNLIKTIEPAGNDNFYIGMQDGGVCLFNLSTRQFKTSPDAARFGEVNALLPLKNKIWVGSKTNGLLRQDNMTGTISSIDLGPNNSNINKILQDNEGNIWVLSNNNDLIKTPGEQVKLLVKYEKGDYEKVHALLYDNQNDIFKATKFGLVKYFNNNESFKQQSFTIKELTDKSSITALYQDVHDHIWIGTDGKGLFMLDEITGKYRKVNEEKLLEKGSILSITGKGNDVFVSSLEGAVHYTIPEDKSLNAPLISGNFSDIGSIGTNYIYNVFKDSKNRIWFATDGKYISVLDNGKVTNFNETNGLKDKVVYSITEDLAGNIWFSTHSAGIYKYDGRQFKNYSVNDGLSDIDISAVKSDKQGNIIIVYKNGIDILNPITGRIWYLNNNEGISEINFNDLGTVTQNNSGTILVSTSDGVLAYEPSGNAVHEPKTILENVELFFSTIDESKKHSFSHDENAFSFSFSGLYYTDPEHIQYIYKLDGYETQWLPTRDRAIPFPKLPPGNYTFRVRSSVNKNFSEENEASFNFVISKPYWMTWWFILACLVAGGGLLFWFVKVRERNVKKVGQLQQEKIKFQFETLRNQVNPHFLFNSFNTLISIIEEEPAMAVEYVEQLSDFFRNIVTYRDKDVITLQEELKLLQAYIFVQKKRFGDNLVLHINVTPEQQMDNFIPPLTLQLLMENAIKHNAISRVTPLQVDIFTRDEFIIISNNINPKITQAEGAGMGLQNIVNRYNLLSKRKVTIHRDTKEFVISLPTLKKQA